MDVLKTNMVKAPDEQNNWLLTREDIEKLPTVEGPSLALTDEEKEVLMQPKPNGGILFPVYQ